MAKFELGKLVETHAVYTERRENKYFDLFVRSCLERYKKCDWGDTVDEDSKLNDKAVKAGDQRIHAVYIFDIDDDPSGQKIWIITEWDHSVTTILFPSDY